MNRPFLIVLVGAVILVAAIVINLHLNGEMGVSSVPSSGPETQSGAPSATASESPAPSEKPIAPSFDIVRINPRGETVIAGRAAPKAEITLMDGEQEIGRVVADDRGEWVFVPDRPLAPGQRKLSLRAKNPDGAMVESDSPVLLVVPDRNDEQQPALAVRIGADGSIDILQGPNAQSETEAPIAITGLRYDPQGRFAVNGRSAPGARIELYLDDKPLAQTEADASGNWRTLSLSVSLAPGERRLRADSVGNDGTVSACAEIIFSLPEKGAEGTASTREKVTTITVEKGDSLWRIASSTLGSGLDFVMIYEANQKQIRDPDLIFPGQIFIIPNKR